MLHCLLHCTFTTTFKSLRNQYHKLILSSKKRVLLQPRIFSPNVFGKQSANSYTASPPHRFPPLLLALHLQTALLLFFTGKISKLRHSVTSHPAISSLHSPSPPATPPNFSVFTPASESKLNSTQRACTDAGVNTSMSASI